MKRKPWKILQQHSHDCPYFNGQNPDSPWFLDGAHGWEKRSGMGRHVLYARCNDMECDGLALVETLLLPDAIGMERGTRCRKPKEPKP